MQIFIRLPSGETIRIDNVTPDTTIQTVKVRIFQQTQIPVERQILIFNGIELNNNNTLGSYNIQNNAILTLIVSAVVSCPAVGFQIVDLCVPVHVRPFATPGPAITRCCGGPIVSPRYNRLRRNACY